MNPVVALFLLCVSVAAAADTAPEIASVRKIWDEAKHSAFTDLIRFQGRWFCSFRESDAHIGSDGKLRILESQDGESWKSAALLAEEGVDLRDPKLSITPDGRLMVVAGGSIYHGTKKLQGGQPRVAFSAEGHTWTSMRPVLESGDWLWRVTWHEGTAYGISYNILPDKADTESSIQLSCSTNAIEWRLVTDLSVPGKPNETTLRVLKSGDMVALVRREAGDQGGWIGSSRPPFADWKFAHTTQRVGGPNFIELPDGTLVAGSRDYSGPSPKLSLFRMTRESLVPVLSLPSAGDCSYPGLVWHEGLLWVSYYSSHEGRTSIYLAKVRWPLRQ